MSCFRVRIILQNFFVNGLQHIFSQIVLDMIRKSRPSPRKQKFSYCIYFIRKRPDPPLRRRKSVIIPVTVIIPVVILFMWARPNPNPFQCPTEALKVNQITSQPQFVSIKEVMECFQSTGRFPLVRPPYH